VTCSVVAKEVEAAMKQTIEAFENQIQRLRAAIPYIASRRIFSSCIYAAIVRYGKLLVNKDKHILQFLMAYFAEYLGIGLDSFHFGAPFYPLFGWF